MSDNLPNVPLTADEPKDLYDATGIPVGTKLEVQNIGACDVYLYSQLNEPTINTDGHQVIKRGEYAENENGDLGAWAISEKSDGLLNIKAAP